jgi:hypothetical protein
VLAAACLLLMQPTIQASEATPGVLVVERISGVVTYTMGGVPLKPDSLYTQVIDGLGPKPVERPLFILFGEAVSLDQAFELGSLFMNKGGLRKLRYFAFSRQTKVMQEFHLDWQRWKLSETGTLEPKPW